MNDRPRLNFLSRATRHTEPTLSPRINLLPRQTFVGTPVLEHFDRFVTLRESISDNQRAEARERAAAEKARADYAVKVREALATGADSSKVKPTAEKHDVAADGHKELARLANHELAHAARALAHAIADHAPDLTSTSEAKLTETGDDMNNAIDALTRAWGAYELAWQERRILGNVGLFGGVIANYDPNPSFPPPVAEALATLRDHVADLDRLKADEALIRAERPDGVQK